LAKPALIRSFGGHAKCLFISPDSRRLAFVDEKADNHELDVWDITGTNPPHTVATTLSSHYQAQAFTPDGRYLFNSDTDRAIAKLDLANDKEVSRFLVEQLSPEELVDAKRPRQWGGIASICLNPDGTKIAVAPLSRRGVDIWDPRTGRKLYSLAEESGPIACLAWSADGQHLSVSSDNGGISVWDLPQIERELAKLGLGP
jgi:WD40 repeat protein